MQADAIQITTTAATIHVAPDDFRHLRAMARDQVKGDAELLREIDQGDAPGYRRDEIAARLAFAEQLGDQVEALNTAA